MHVVWDHEPVVSTKIHTETLLQPEASGRTENAEELILQISRLIKRETNLGVQEMTVCFIDGKIILRGYCRTFYTKQLAQEAALKLLGNVELVNDIRVA